MIISRQAWHVSRRHVSVTVHESRVKGVVGKWFRVSAHQFDRVYRAQIVRSVSTGHPRGNTVDGSPRAYTWLEETEIISNLEEQYFIAQRQGKSQRRVVTKISKILA